MKLMDLKFYINDIPIKHKKKRFWLQCIHERSRWRHRAWSSCCLGTNCLVRDLFVVPSQFLLFLLLSHKITTTKLCSLVQHRQECQNNLHKQLDVEFKFGTKTTLHYATGL